MSQEFYSSGITMTIEKGVFGFAPFLHKDNSGMARILIIDDDACVSDLRTWLTQEGYEIDRAKTAREGLLQLQKQEHDVAVVGWQLPDMTAAEICTVVSNSNLFTPVMVLGARQDVEDKIAALDAGAQDFLVKPCPLLELSARLRSLLRRYSRKNAAANFVPAIAPVNIPFTP
jgi:DNA-binding response OmpR family regulator